MLKIKRDRDEPKKFKRIKHAKKLKEKNLTKKLETSISLGYIKYIVTKQSNVLSIKFFLIKNRL